MATRGARTGQAFAVLILATLLWGSAALADSPYFGTGQTLKGHSWGVVARTCEKQGGGTGTFRLLGIPVDAGGYTRVRRAEIVASRLNQMHQAGAFTDPNRIYIGQLNGEVVIMIRRDEGAKHIVTVDTKMARYYGTNVWTAAAIVCQRLQYCAQRIVINADGTTSESALAAVYLNGKRTPAADVPKSVSDPIDFTEGGLEDLEEGTHDYPVDLDERPEDE